MQGWLLFAFPTHGPGYDTLLVVTLAAGFGLVGLLTVIPTQLRKPTIAIFTFLAGLYYSLEFFYPVSKLPDGTQGNFLTSSLPIAGNVSQSVVALSYGLGVVSLLVVHFRSLVRKKEGWGYSSVVLVSFVLMIVFGLLNKYSPSTQVFPATGINGKIDAADIFNLLFNGGLTQLDSAMFALIAFFIVSASYRAFRIRTVESSLLMISALLVMLGQVTLGTAITSGLPTTGVLSHLRLENISQYILLEINAPAYRAIIFGISVGFLATSLRLWLSLERGAFFDQEA
jgi:hypothetical protein